MKTPSQQVTPSAQLGTAYLTSLRARFTYGLVTTLGLFCLATAALAQATFFTILSNGPTANRINVVILSEGYTTSQLPQFLVDATNLITSFLAEEPYHEYQGRFNAFAIAVASTQSGSDHPSQSYYRNTYFSSSYETDGIASFITIPPNGFDTNYSHGQGKVDSLLQQYLPESDLSILLVNDPLYGGAGGRLLIASRSTSAPEIVRHEAGHSLAGLGDEYADPYPGYPDVEEPNTTRETQRDLIKWKAWIAATNPVPTPATLPYANAVGLFEGAHYHTNGWYRPKLDCKMRTLGLPFCEVCREALVKSVYQRVSPIDSFSPLLTNVTSLNTQSLVFSVKPLQPSSHAMGIQWFTNGIRVRNWTNATLTLGAGVLGIGQQTIRALATDATAWVRSDPSNLLQRAVVWSLRIDPSDLRLIPTAPINTHPSAFSFLVVGPSTNQFVLQTSSGLSGWQPLLTNRLSAGKFTFSDTNASGNGRRFYRATMPGP